MNPTASVVMASQPTHTKILNGAAREVLRPLGLMQRGRSRLWYDDGRWYAIVVEFKPSGFSKGSTLNVGVHWLWYPADRWSFDLPVDLRAEWVEFRDEEQFRPGAQRLAQLASQAVLEMRGKMATLEDAYATLAANYAALRPLAPGHWYHLHLGILAALAGKVEEARSLGAEAIRREQRSEFDSRYNLYIERFLRTIDDGPALRQWIEENIAECRALLKLEELPPPVLPDR